MTEPETRPRTCLAIDPTCERCARRAKRRGYHDQCDDLCRLMAKLLDDEEGHQALHAAEYCQVCGHPGYDDDEQPTEIARRCKYGNCVNWHCAGCDKWSGSAGPVGCRCNSTWVTRMWLHWWNWRDRRRSR